MKSANLWQCAMHSLENLKYIHFGKYSLNAFQSDNLRWRPLPDGVIQLAAPNAIQLFKRQLVHCTDKKTKAHKYALQFVFIELSRGVLAENQPNI